MLSASMLTAVVLLGPLLVTAASLGTSGDCKCLSSDACWPDDTAFSELASQVSQPLVKPEPPASPCYPPSNPSGNCSEVQEFWQDGNWRADRVGAMHQPNFEDFIFDNGTISACYLNTTLGFPCEQGNIPVIGVDARTIEDVQVAVKFASANNLRLVIKNTGHDFLGRSAGRDSFVIWTHHLKNITIHDTFTPEGGPTNETYSKAITLGSGVQFREAWDAAHTMNRTLVGVPSPGGSVGAAGGWMQGGGHSALSPTYGLGVDNVLQVTVVTADGQHLTASSHQNSDLFWAIRGGGGGTWGVVTSVTYRSHPDDQVIAGFFSTSIKANTTGSTPALVKLVTEYLRHSTNLTDGGWGGYTFLDPAASGEASALSLLLVAPNKTWAEANATFNPFVESAAAVAANSTMENGGLLTITNATTVPFESFHAWLESEVLNGPGEIADILVASRLLPKTQLESNPEEIAQTILQWTGANFYLVAGGAVSKVDPDSVGLNPAWRKATIHSVWGAIWSEGTSVAEINDDVAVQKQQLDVIHRVVPDTGAYFNEASLFETDFQEVFFGDHYPKLKEIKQRYDPEDLFIVPKGVGSEAWDDLLHCRV